jgi:hypothetical protein
VSNLQRLSKNLVVSLSLIFKQLVGAEVTIIQARRRSRLVAVRRVAKASTHGAEGFLSKLPFKLLQALFFFLIF